jgi:hypothetical protein
VQWRDPSWAFHDMDQYAEGVRAAVRKVEARRVTRPAVRMCHTPMRRSRRPHAADRRPRAMTRPAGPLLGLPDNARLGRLLAEALRHDPATVNVLDRSVNTFASTWPTEIVHCRVGERYARLFIKHGPSDARKTNGNPGGPRYEATVYETALRPAGLAFPFLGAAHDRETQSTSVVLKFVDGFLHVNQSFDRTAVVRAAAWIGTFHARAARDAEIHTGTLNRYDADYYAHCAYRSRSRLSGLAGEFPWLSEVCTTFVEIGARLAAGPSTVIHGELYPSNVLLQDGVVRPVDWEWAGIGAGEIDLAALTENWDEPWVSACTQAYIAHRWPRGAPADFRWRLDAGQAYMHLRILSEDVYPTDGPALRQRLHALLAVAQRLGVARPGVRR